MRKHRIESRASQTVMSGGFSLIELLLAFSLGISLSGVILQFLIQESRLGLRVTRLMRERSVQERTLDLIRQDVQYSHRISRTPQLEQHGCNLAGRLAVLHLSTRSGPVTYSVGAAPSSIWRGQVLMRCGSGFDLSGRPSTTIYPQNRVVIDGLAGLGPTTLDCAVDPSGEHETLINLADGSRGFSACLSHAATDLYVRMTQSIDDFSGEQQSIHSQRLISNSI